MPERKAFTDKLLAALRPTQKRYVVFDPSRRGLIFRIEPSGTKTFAFRYQRQGTARIVTIGAYPAIPLRLAYEAHAECVRRLNRGEDLGAAELSFKVRNGPNGTLTGEFEAAPDQGPTVGELAAEFLRRYIYRARKQPEQAEAAIESNILRHWRNRPAKSITRRDGVLLLDRIVDRGAPVMANHVAALLAQMFRFGVERGILDGSPFIAVPRPGGTEKARTRKLDEREVRVFWRALRRTRLSFEVRMALKLILVTAQRPGEVALATRDEFDLENRIWRIPAERSKNGQPHEVPLSDLALALLRHLQRRFGESQYLLPSRVWRMRGAAPITVRSLSQGIRDQAKHFVAMEKFTPHDLRRTAASLMTANGIPRLHVEKVLNHTIDDVAEIYDRHDYAPEKRAALHRLGDAIVHALRNRNRNVVTFAARGQPIREPEIYPDRGANPVRVQSTKRA